jgi:hypothetical protein
MGTGGDVWNLTADLGVMINLKLVRPSMTYSDLCIPFSTLFHGILFPICSQFCSRFAGRFSRSNRTVFTSPPRLVTRIQETPYPIYSCCLSYFLSMPITLSEFVIT